MRLYESGVRCRSPTVWSLLGELRSEDLHECSACAGSAALHDRVRALGSFSARETIADRDQHHAQLLAFFLLEAPKQRGFGLTLGAEGVVKVSPTGRLQPREYEV